MSRFAFYGGSFDPVHNGHLAVGRVLLEQFGLDEFTFIPAFHAPHKRRLKPTSAYDRYTMLCLATQIDPRIRVSRMEIDVPERPFSVETLARLNERFPQAELFFVMGADSWMEITAWREWEKVLTMANHIVVTRPGTDIAFSHVTDTIKKRIIDIRAMGEQPFPQSERAIYITDAVQINISATEIRRKIRDAETSWHADVPAEVANYIEKYQIYN